MGNVSLQLLFLIVLSTFIYFDAIKLAFCHDGLNVSCIDIEKKALLEFKSSLFDPSGRLSSWRSSEDCCRWRGVSCSTKTKHVIRLDLRNPVQDHLDDLYLKSRVTYRSTLRGKISSSLLDLKYLSYLDLSWNNFNSQIPEFFGSLENLRYLNLSHASFYGSIPQSLGNLSNLQYLDLSHYYYFSAQDHYDLHWVSGLSSLKYLDLSFLNFNGTVSYWLQNINTLPFLLELHLSRCQLLNLSPFLPSINFTSLSVLDLSYNDIDSTIPQWLFNLSSLKQLDLSFNNLRGMIPDAISKLSSLKQLDLNSNSLQGVIPDAFSNLSSLKQLDLSSNNLQGVIPYAFSKLSSLKQLDLSSNSLQGVIPDIFSKLSSLKQLDLSFNSFQGVIPDAFYKLSSLKQLDLSSNSLQGVIPDAFSKLSALETLDLSENKAIEGKLPRSLGKLCNLKVLGARFMNITGDITDFIRSLSECSNNSLQMLDLGFNNLNGNLPKSLGFLKNLQSLHLEGNSFTGTIPETIGNLSSLKELDLSDNQMNGNIAKNLGQLSSLVSLRLSGNSWEGIITEAHLLNLSSLEQLSLDLSGNSPNISLVFNISSDWIPHFKLRYIEIQSCGLGHEFPKLLKNQTELEVVILNNARISDTIPDWFMKLNLQLSTLDLAHNQLRGKVPNSLRFASDATVDLRSNLFEGPIPVWSSNIRELHLNDNMFCGQIPPDIGIRMPNLYYLNISSNFLDGSLPMSLGNMRDLIILAISNNRLSGELPSGLRNCNWMEALDLGDNQLSGNLPVWVGEAMPFLEILRVRNNSFTGNIPSQLCSLSFLHILDLSKNNLSGTIPPCIGNLTGFNTESLDHPRYEEALQIITKGRILQYYASIISLFKSINLSENDVSGEIPTTITLLNHLNTLNLSMNHLTGNIPSDIGSMKLLETLDLSINRLSGPIPTSMASLTFLSHLNLSHNNLSGYIPTSNQFQTFNDPSIYIGNTALCGIPLHSKCGNETSITDRDGDKNYNNEDSEDDELDKLKLFVVVGLGFFLGFWGVCGTLIIKKHLREAFFLFLLRMKDKICGVLTSN